MPYQSYDDMPSPSDLEPDVDRVCVNPGCPGWEWDTTAEITLSGEQVHTIVRAVTEAVANAHAGRHSAQLITTGCEQEVLAQLHRAEAIEPCVADRPRWNCGFVPATLYEPPDERYPECPECGEPGEPC